MNMLTDTDTSGGSSGCQHSVVYGQTALTSPLWPNVPGPLSYEDMRGYFMNLFR